MGCPRGGAAGRLAITDTQTHSDPGAPAGVSLEWCGRCGLSSPGTALPPTGLGRAWGSGWGTSDSCPAGLCGLLSRCLSCRDRPSCWPPSARCWGSLASRWRPLPWSWRSSAPSPWVRARPRAWSLCWGECPFPWLSRDPGTLPLPPPPGHTMDDLNAYCVLPLGSLGQHWGRAEGFVAV